MFLDYYSLFQSLDLSLWKILLDVLLFDATNSDQFREAFYPIFETFPEICDKRSPIKDYWTDIHNRIDPLSESALDDPYTDCYPRAIDFIVDDAEAFIVTMAIRQGIVARHVRFDRYTTRPKRHKQHEQCATDHLRHGDKRHKS